jgi:hypothetical protein
MADQRKAELIAELERARVRASANSQALRTDVAFRPKIRRAFQRNRTAYLGGAALFGLLLSKIPPRTKKVKVKVKTWPWSRDKQQMKTAGKAGIMFALLKLALDLGKPSMVAWVTSKISGAGAGAAAGRKAGGLG